MVPDDPIVKNRFKYFGIAEKLYDLPTNAPLGGVQLYTPLLIGGTMGYLGDLYIKDHCSVPRQALDLEKTILDPSLTNVDATSKPQIFVRVQKQNIKTGDVGPCDPFWPRARNQFNKNPSDLVYEPNTEFGSNNSFRPMVRWPAWMDSNYGFLVTLRAIYKPVGSQTTETCEIQRSYQLPQAFQNVIDYTRDIHALKTTSAQGPLAGAPVDPVREDTTMLSTKGDVFGPGAIQPIATNYYLRNNIKVRERPMCSQDSTEMNREFTLKLELGNLQNEPGVIPLCLDSSHRWMDDLSGNPKMWCSKTSAPTPNVSVLIVPDVNRDQRLWVPCEQLKVCGETPIKVKTTLTPLAQGKSNLLYEWTYKFSNDTNPQKSLLWGCEMKYKVALSDPSGNLSYIKDKAITAATKTANPLQSVRSSIKEIEPQIYFRPPPCYQCNCKPCKGGLFGGLFNLILAIIVLVLFGLVGLFLCLTGILFNCFGGDYTIPDFARADYVTCDPNNPPPGGICPCGKNCKFG